MPTTHPRHADNSSPPRKPNPIVLSLFLKPIIMLFILSFFFFLGIAAVSLLLVLLAGSSLHLCRRRRRRPPAAAVATLPVEDLQKYLPRFNYDARLESAKDCAVCLECFKEGEWCRRLADCNHVFHETCVDSWLTKVLNCPICRSPINLNLFGSGSFMSEDDDFKLWWPVGV